MATAVSHAPAEVQPAAAALAPVLPFPSSWKVSLHALGDSIRVLTGSSQASIGHWWAHSSSAGHAAQNALLKRGLRGTGIQLRDYDGTPLDDGSATSTSGNDKVAQLRQIELGGKDRMLNVLEVGTPVRKEGEQTFVVLHGTPTAYASIARTLSILIQPPHSSSRLRRSICFLLAELSCDVLNTKLAYILDGLTRDGSIWKAQVSEYQG
jgi:hypothetical protein